LGEIGFAQKTVAAARALQYDERLGRGVSPFSACCCSTSTDRYYVAAGGVNAGLNKQDGWGRKVVCDFDQATTNPIERAIEKKTGWRKHWGSLVHDWPSFLTTRMRPFQPKFTKQKKQQRPTPAFVTLHHGDEDAAAVIVLAATHDAIAVVDVTSCCSDGGIVVAKRQRRRGRRSAAP
jgi:hypothetical protein